MSEKRDKVVHIAFTEEEKKKIRDLAKSDNMTSSEFVRQSVKDRIRRIENPLMFSNQNLDNEVLQKIYKLQLEQKQLLESNVKHGKIVNSNMKQLKERVNDQQVKLYRERVIDILRNHGSLRVEQISEKTSIDDDDIIKVLSVLQEENIVKLNIQTGRWDLND